MSVSPPSMGRKIYDLESVRFVKILRAFWVYYENFLDGHNEETDRNLLRETKCRSGSDSTDF